MARRTGVREPVLQAIEEGRFADVPRGLYGRAAIRRYSDAVGLPPDEILAAYERLLPPAEDPIAALARLRGVRSARPATATASSTGSAPQSPPDWRSIAAALVDGIIVAAMLLAVMAATVTAAGVPASVLGRAATPAFALVGLVLASCYFVLFGGIGGATCGERLADLTPRPSDEVDLRTVATRAWGCAFRDVALIERLGEWCRIFAEDKAVRRFEEGRIENSRGSQHTAHTTFPDAAGLLASDRELRSPS